MRPILLLALTLFTLGCQRNNAVQRWRDERLQAPVQSLPAQAVLGNERPANPVVVVEGKRLYARRAENRNRKVSLAECLQQALRQSQVVRVSEGDRVTTNIATFYDVELMEERTQQALAEFDAALEASFLAGRYIQPPNAFFLAGVATPSQRDEGAFNLGLRQKHITGAQTSILFNPDPGYLLIPGSMGINPRYLSELEMSVTQPLLRGAGAEVNRAPLAIAQTSSEQSAWEFKRGVMASVRSVVESYWALHASHDSLRSINEVVRNLQEVVRIQEESFRAQWVIAADVAKAQAQLHRFRQEQLQLESRLRERELQLRHLLGLPPHDGENLVPSTRPITIESNFDTDSSWAVAIDNHPDMARGRLALRIREVQLAVARNGLKPNLDLQLLYRLNGIGRNVGNALDQMVGGEFPDLQLRATYSMPVGRRAGRSLLRAAHMNLRKDQDLLQQTALRVTHQISNELRQVDYSFQEYVQATKQLAAANKWLQGSRLRYRNPNPEAGGTNWLLQNLNDYLDALRFRQDAAANAAQVLARYNTSLARLQESQGTILGYFDIHFTLDPCKQVDVASCGLPSFLVGEGANGPQLPQIRIERLPPVR